MLSWYDLLDGLINIKKELQLINKQEKMIIDNFIQYLGFFNYTAFNGFLFDKLLPNPKTKLNFQDTYNLLFSLKKLKLPPKTQFDINLSTDNLSNFYSIKQKPIFSIIFKGDG